MQLNTPAQPQTPNVNSEDPSAPIRCAQQKVWVDLDDFWKCFQWEQHAQTHNVNRAVTSRRPDIATVTAIIWVALNWSFSFQLTAGFPQTPDLPPPDPALSY